MNDINIFDAVENNNINLVKEYLIGNGDVNIKNWEGLTPLHYAARCGNDTILECLIANGADVNIHDNDIHDNYGNTPIFSAAYLGNETSVRVLIAKGARVNIQGRYGWTPLHNAAAKGHDSIVQCLITNGAIVNIKDDDGRTPLERAINQRSYHPLVIRSYINIVNILLPLTNLTNIEDSYKLYKSKFNTEVDNVMNVLIKGRDNRRYFTFCELFSIGTNPVEDDNKKQEKNSLMIGYDAPLDVNEEEVRPFPPMFDSNLDESLFDATLVGEIWEYARDFLREDEINNYRYLL